MFFNQKEEEYVDIEEPELFYNPDPFVNRMNLVIRLTRELEVSQSEISKEVLYRSIKLTLKSIDGEEYEHVPQKPH